MFFAVLLSLCMPKAKFFNDKGVVETATPKVEVEVMEPTLEPPLETPLSSTVLSFPMVIRLRAWMT